jgi:NAD(P)-dependent dehydrogenase (short-subunit alcohol dehydrogenase family)
VPHDDDDARAIVAYLATAPYVNGTVLVVDGGRLARDGAE